MSDKWEYTDVHTSHCCVQHGCKYGRDETCTVTTGKGRQEYPCEDCDLDGLQRTLKAAQSTFDSLKDTYEKALDTQRYRAEKAEKEMRRLEDLVGQYQVLYGDLK